MSTCLWMGVMMVCGAVCTAHFYVPVYVWVIVVGLAAVVVLRSVTIGITVGSFGLGCLAVCTQPQGPVIAGDVAIQGVVVGNVSGRYSDVWVHEWRHVHGVPVATTGRVTVGFQEGAPHIGTKVAVFGSAEPIQWQRLPGAPSRSMASKLGRIQTVVHARSWAHISHVPKREVLFLKAKWRGLLRALTTGDRSEISEQTVTLMRRTGTSHMLAISGYHIGVVAGFVVLILRALLGILSLFRPQGFSARWVWAGGFVAASYYAFAVGMPVSAQRALVALAFYAGGHFLGRKTTAGTLVGLAMVALVWFDPAAIGGPSFQLSFGAMVGIVRVYPRLTARIPSDLPLLIDKLLRAMSISVAAIIGTLPTALWWFQELSVVGPIANLIVGPLMGGIVIPLAFVGSVFAPLEVYCGALADHVLDLNFALLSLVDRPLIYFGITASLMLGWTVVLLWPRDRLLWIFGACCTLLNPVPRMGTNVTFLPVGQGDAVLVQFQNGRTWLVDGGPSPLAVVRWLRRQRIYRLDVVVATHDHPDHTTGLAAVLSQLQVGELWLPGGGGFASLRAVSDTPFIENPEGRLWPPKTPDKVLSENDRSLVLSLRSQGCVALLTGDIETESGLRLSLVDLLKVAHHGSKTSTSASFVGATLPLVAVAQMGVGNSFGHPHTAVVSRLNAAGTHLYRTDLDGLVQVNLRDGWLRVFTRHNEEDNESADSDQKRDPLRCRDGLAKH